MSTLTLNTSILERIDEWALKTPEHPCYIHKNDSLTYSTLKKESDALANYLLTNVTTRVKNQPIVVYGHMSPYMLVSFLACSKAGHAYVPVDISMPTERIKHIIDASEPAFVICTEALPSEIISNDMPIIQNKELLTIIQENLGKNLTNNTYVQDEENYYIIFTSGSTGTPKGVQISHNNLVSFTNWILQDFDITEGKCFLNQAPFSFDLSVMDLYPALVSGGTLLPLDKSTSENMKDLYKTLSELNINIWVSTPSFVDLCLMDPNFTEVQSKEITHFLFCGETLTKHTAKELMKRFPNAKIFNTYGPTEATVAVSSVRITEDIINTYPSLPLGRIKEDTLLLITDETGNLLPEGEKGEAILVGPSVSKGYLKNPTKTKEVFFKYNHTQAYRTGDCGLIQDQMLFFQGRLDFQIKLHGYRIELEDIENNLKEVSYIHSGVVIPKIREGKVDSLVAMVIPNEHSFEKEYQLSAAIKKELAKSMPSYMIPRKWIYKTEFPLTINSKIDRKKLNSEVNK
ncbi:D-alanine--poly(phosphoribitol) ligase subunit DltA [Bacillus massiliigorillae]|uniref:D-alanine--poly(phosphoribitol) ligase subunit DltA n=1 Tax=Bacillus massiliigorillae TaxID=1243664 RepID=UPI0003A5D6D2|nr:D-alanine--poly(phosphoribitol) ligase subunit DltA [Bacillus massiliigorillae]